MISIYSKYIKYLIKRSKVVSFDMFDTLVYRKIGSPSDVFKIVEQLLPKFNINIDNFYEQRLAAEEKAKLKYNKKIVNFEEIYECIDFKTIRERKEAKQIEKQVEYDTLTKNDKIMDFYNFAVKQNKKIVVTTDMYYDEKFLSEILKKENLSFDAMYVSSEYGVSKSQGNLFDVVIDNNKIEKKDLLHIGDSKKGDFIKPLSKKIKSCLINKNKIKNNLLLNMTDTEIKIYNNIDSPNKKNLYKNYFDEVGYNSFGPLLLGFVNWLLLNLKEEKIDKVYFLARDGYILQKAFDEINNTQIKSVYLYVSRRSTSVPLIWQNSDFDNLDKTIIMSKQFRITDFIKRLGLEDKNYEKQKLKFNISNDEVFTKINFKKSKKLRDFYNEIKEDVISNSKIEYEKILSYLKQEKFDGKVAIVDIGWHGSIQKNLSKLLSNVDIKGYYMGCDANENMFGFLYDSLKNDKQIYNHLPYGIFETLLLAHHGSLKKYEYSDNKKVIPIFEEYEFKEEKELQNNINQIHYSALTFIQKNKSNYIYKINTSCKPYLENLYKLMNLPSNRDIAIFGNMPFYDTFYTRIIVSKGLLYYVIHPLKFINDFNTSTWREGFLKKVFKLNIKYYKIIEGIRWLYGKSKN